MDSGAKDDHTAEKPVGGGAQDERTAAQLVDGGAEDERTANPLARGGEDEYGGGPEDLMPHAAVMATWFEAQRALHLNHQQLADLVGSSKRTVERWSGGHGAPYPDNITKLAAAVYASDPGIARRLAAFLGHSLESLGIAKPPPPPPAPPPPPPVVSPPAPSPLTPLLVQSIVAAAAEALDVSPRAVRPAVLAAVECAKAAGLSVDDMLAVLRPPAPAKRGKS